MLDTDQLLPCAIGDFISENVFTFGQTVHFEIGPRGRFAQICQFGESFAPNNNHAKFLNDFNSMYFLPLDILPLRFALEGPLSAALGQGHPVQEAVVAEQQQGGLRAHASWGR